MKKNILDWKMNYREYKDIPCTVPCSMYSVMLENGYMEDPFFGLNEIDATKMSDYDTEFISNFIIEKQELENQYINLNFLGLDTLGEIWLNGKFLGKTKNMHRKYSFDVKDYLNPGENQIKIILSSPTEYFKRMSNNYTVHSIKETMKGSPYLRKTLCMSGWDWGPKLPDMGIFRPVELEFYNYGKIEDFFVRQYHKKNQVDLSVEVEVSGAYDDVYVNINNQKVKVENGQAEIKISNP